MSLVTSLKNDPNDEKAHVKQASEKKQMFLHMPYAVRSTAGDDHVSVI
jgi:hypothetical protein